MNIKIHKLIGESTAYDKKQILKVKRPKSWIKSVYAFANGEGGTLVFCISDDGHVVGLADAKGDAEKISEEIKSKLAPVPAVNLELKEADGKTLVLSYVYPGQETSYYYIGDKQRLAFIRVGNESLTADHIQFKNLVQKVPIAHTIVCNPTIDLRIWHFPSSNLFITKGCSVRLKTMSLFRGG